MMKLLSLAAIAASGLVSAQPVPLPNTYPGFSYFNPASSPPMQSTVMIEGFLDLLCPDCSGAWPTVVQVLEHYGAGNVSFTFHVFPLPYHTYAFLMAQGAQVIKSLNGTDAAVYDYINLIFQNQDNFYTDTNSSSQVVTALSELVAANLPYSQTDFANGMNDDNLNELARIGWKYATSRYSTGTPHFLVNGIPVDDQLNDETFADWCALIDPLLPSSSSSAKGKKNVSAKKNAKKGKKISQC